jgi:hypothetical protein
MELQTGTQPETRVVGVAEIPPSLAASAPVPPREDADSGGELNRSWLSIGLVAAASVLRLVSPIPNCTPVGGLALFGGGRLRLWQAFALPLLVMILTDAVKTITLAPLGLRAINWATPWIYASFLLYVFLGRWLCRNRGVMGIGLASLLGSLQFFLITNFGFWVTNEEVFFPYTWQGLIQCYTVALAFFGGTLGGDLLYSGVLFGGYALATRLATAPKARLLS